VFFSPTRRCGDCGYYLDLTYFSFKSFKSAERGDRQTRCRVCQAEYYRRYYRKNAARYKARVAANNKLIRRRNRQRLHDYLRDQSCADCGIRDFAVLEFDHRDPASKRALISDLVRTARAWRTIVAEIQKCDVVCANCHRRRTARYFGWHKQAEPMPPPLPALPKRGTPEYERLKSRRSGRARRHRNRFLVWQYLVEHPCAICGINDPIVLEFDHWKASRAISAG
jgi:hypothetical protein